MTAVCRVDDKFVPLYRIMWVAAVPHFCGSEDCQREGLYEIRLEQGEAVWAATSEERDAVVAALQQWDEYGGLSEDDDSDEQF